MVSAKSSSTVDDLLQRILVFGKQFYCVISTKHVELDIYDTKLKKRALSPDENVLVKSSNMIKTFMSKVTSVTPDSIIPCDLLSLICILSFDISNRSL